jgi:hypothetical protein
VSLDDVLQAGSMTRGRVRRRWTAPVSAWSFFVMLWLGVAGIAIGLYVAGAFD